MKLISILMVIAFVAAGCKSSPDSGATNTESILISDPSRQASSVYLTSDKANNPMINWSETDKTGSKHFLVSFFDTAAGVFNDVIKIPIEQNANLHEEGMPKIACKADGTIIAMYETSTPTATNKYAGSLRYVQSFDGGVSWTSPANVHADTSEGKSRSFASITRLSSGEVGACWLDASYDEKKGGRPVRFAATNGRNGFSNEI
ncbi:MAG: hypothetical protein EOO01_41480 [Chitinophagaceae bacterium]|nr:MAG: hypothetical protein EOO01_41480 [Chitinophagaceae bacterium]